jgi:hypothetical protein
MMAEGIGQARLTNTESRGAIPAAARRIYDLHEAGFDSIEVARPDQIVMLSQPGWAQIAFKNSPITLATSLRAIPPAFSNPWFDCTICTQLRDCRKHLSYLGSAEECGLLRDVCRNCNTCKCDHPARK